MITTTLSLPAQAAAETEATIISWNVKPGDTFVKGAVLAEAESAKSTFQFEAPAAGVVVRILEAASATVSFETPVIEIQTSDAAFLATAPKATQPEAAPQEPVAPKAQPKPAAASLGFNTEVSLLGIGSYLPKRVVTNADLLKEFPDITEEYIFGVTGIKERRWADIDEKPSTLAYHAAVEAIAKSGLKPSDIGAIVLATDTPDFSMPSTACILQGMLGITSVPCFDLNAACSGWLYALTMAKGMLVAGIADNILCVGVDMQSRLLDKKDKDTYFLFGDGAGATVLARTSEGHRIKKEMLFADSSGLRLARREYPGYEIPANSTAADPYVRLDGKALFRHATGGFAKLVADVIAQSGWLPDEVRWVVPHQANARILKAAAQKSGVPFERFFLNIDHVGNTSCASIPIALAEIEKFLHRNDKIVFCTVGAGLTSAAITLEW